MTMSGGTRHVFILISLSFGTFGSRLLPRCVCGCVGVGVGVGMGVGVGDTTHLRRTLQDSFMYTWKASFVYTWHDSCIYVWHDSFTYMRHDLFIYMWCPMHKGYPARPFRVGRMAKIKFAPAKRLNLGLLSFPLCGDIGGKMVIFFFGGLRC